MLRIRFKLVQRGQNAKFKVVASKVGSTEVAGRSAYHLENEALSAIGAEIIEIAADSDEEYLEKAKDTDAIISGRKLNRTVIEGLNKCKVISLGSVGTDGVCLLYTSPSPRD